MNVVRIVFREYMLIGFGSAQDGDEKSLVLSDRHGAGEVVVLNYPSEYLTGIEGECSDHYRHGIILASLVFHTNQRKFGPFGDDKADSDFSFKTGEAFNGYSNEQYLRGIGVYVKPKACLFGAAAAQPSTHVVKSVKWESM
ncbi:hypothetical protein IFM89_035555 [Coptis chinensis]|uniref:Jacalin-type lectin domain-containing protein n=1 Tax=Coptis chinensis TaxID=261450 RepID=A0A835LWC7_9MAGN|nr:hypothetical protein IFM89_035555 [Coptis chinensis]